VPNPFVSFTFSIYSLLNCVCTWIRGTLLVFPVLKLVIEKAFHNGNVVTSAIILLLELYPYNCIIYTKGFASCKEWCWLVVTRSG